MLLVSFKIDCFNGHLFFFTEDDEYGPGSSKKKVKKRKTRDADGSKSKKPRRKKAKKTLDESAYDDAYLDVTTCYGMLSVLT